MGEEFAADTPFLFFCDFEADLAKAVTEGRRAEFARFAQFSDTATRNRIPDPNAETTFLASKLNWDSLQESRRAEWLNFYSNLLLLRKREIVPLLRDIDDNPSKGSYSISQITGLTVCWQLRHKTLQLQANLGDDPVNLDPANGRLIYSTFAAGNAGEMPAWSAAWFVNA
jgi:1,4-alpha-glucan branching enzyme/maltooligosyltrehalose trehalohydrolase